MECPEPKKNNAGMWNCPRVTKYSRETQELVKLMMRESRVSHFQQRQIHKQMEAGGALPQMSDLTCRPVSGPQQANVPPRNRQQRRSAEQCQAGDAYSRDAFKPQATRDLEKEKMRLQNIFATGHDEPRPQNSQPARPEREQQCEKDRFQEHLTQTIQQKAKASTKMPKLPFLDEIEERREFLEEMTALGQGKQYQHIINTEICQKIRELELIDRARSEQLGHLMSKEAERKDKN